MSLGRLLVVDDDPQIQRMLQSQLGARGYEVRVVGNGPDALLAAVQAGGCHRGALGRGGRVILDFIEQTAGVGLMRRYIAPTRLNEKLNFSVDQRTGSRFCGRRR